MSPSCARRPSGNSTWRASEPLQISMFHPPSDIRTGFPLQCLLQVVASASMNCLPQDLRRNRATSLMGRAAGETGDDLPRSVPYRSPLPDASRSSRFRISFYSFPVAGTKPLTGCCDGLYVFLEGIASSAKAPVYIRATLPAGFGSMVLLSA